MNVRRLGWVAVLVCCGVAHGSGSGPAPRADSMFAIYEQNRTNGTANYITADFLLTSYSLVLGNVTRQAEATIATQLSQVVQEIRAAVPAADDPAAVGAREYLTVLAALLEEPPPDVEMREAVRQELDAITSAKSVARSPIGRQLVDYTQFRVRGEYARDPKRARYFRAMKYAGGILFAARDSRATGITKDDADVLTAEAAMLTRLAWNNPGLRAKVEGIERSLSWMFGPADDLSFADYVDLIGSGDRSTPDLRRTILEWARAQGREPRVISAVVDASKLEAGVTAAQAVTGWRFLPQRVTPDAAAMQQLVFDHVGAYRGSGKPVSLTMVNGRPVKGYPLANELMAALGSKAAGEKLKASDEQNYEGYPAAEVAARALLERRDATLGSAHIDLLRSYLAGELKAGREASHRRLNTALVFWTRLRHLSVAHVKQSYTASGKGMSRDPERRTAYIDPEVEVYEALAHVASSAPDATAGRPAMQAFAALLRRCAEIAKKERGGAVPGGEDADFLNGLDAELLALAGDRDRPVVVDVHTDPSGGQVLLEGVALPVVVQHKAGARDARGAVAAHVEFKRPMDSRPTDEEWMALLQTGFAPAQASERQFQNGRRAASNNRER